MYITLLPPVSSTVAAAAVHERVTLTPGARIEATVLATGRDGRTSLSLAGRDVTTRTALPFPQGTVLQLEVAGGGGARLRLVAATVPQPDAASSTSAAPGSPVSMRGYGLVAAVLAARDGPDVRGAAQTVTCRIPALVAGGFLASAEGDALRRALAPIPVPPDPTEAGDDGASTGTLARAVADRVAQGGLMLERRLADAVRRQTSGRPARTPVRAGEDGGTHDAVMTDLRWRLAMLARRLPARPDLEAARAELEALQVALLSAQARAAAYLARDGVVDVRVPLRWPEAGEETVLRLRVSRDAPATGRQDDATPWRRAELDLGLAGFGRVKVRLGVQAGDVRAEFVVEHPDSADCIEAGLPELITALEGAGFSQVATRVVVDPVHACAPEDLPELPTQPSIVDARA